MASGLEVAQPGHAPAARFTFAQGLVIGQASIILLVVLFIRYVVFEDPKVTQDALRKRQTKVKIQRARSASLAASHTGPANTKPPPSYVPDILPRLGYDLSSHPPESADWLNVIIAQAIVAYRSLLHGEVSDGAEADVASTGKPKREKARETVEEALNHGRGPSDGLIGVDYIKVTEVDFGDQYPLCSNARVRPADETGRLRVEVDVDYADHVTLGIETSVLINFPRPRFAISPVSLRLTLTSLSATVMAEIPSAGVPIPPASKDPDSPQTPPSPAILLSLSPDFCLSLTCTSLLGSRAKLQDIPKIKQLILSRMRAWILDNLVWPKVRILRLPGVGRRGNVEAEEGEGEYVWVEGASESPSAPRGHDLFGRDTLAPAARDSGQPQYTRAPDPAKHPEADEDEYPFPSVSRIATRLGLSSVSPLVGLSGRGLSTSAPDDDELSDPDDTQSLPGYFYDTLRPRSSPATGRSGTSGANPSPAVKSRKPSSGAHLGRRAGSGPQTHQPRGVLAALPATGTEPANLRSAWTSPGRDRWAASGVGIGGPRIGSPRLGAGQDPEVHSSGYGIRERVKEAQQAMVQPNGAASRSGFGASTGGHPSMMSSFVGPGNVERRKSAEWTRNFGPVL